MIFYCVCVLVFGRVCTCVRVFACVYLSDICRCVCVRVCPDKQSSLNDKHAVGNV